jgi:ketosteroid isomerase-like protein
MSVLRANLSLSRAALVAAGVSILSTMCAPEEQEEYQAMLASLVESERAFGRAAADLGTRDAFLAYLTDDAVIFRPRAVEAGPFLRGQPSAAGLLAWEPAFAVVGQAGDLGFTTGPWEFRPDPVGDPAAHGQYFSFWKKQADGSWKVVLDHGTFNPPPGKQIESVETPRRPVGSRPDARSMDIEAERQDLMERDRSFALAAQAQGKLQALNAFMTGDVRLLRNGRQPLIGIEAARSYAGGRPGVVNWSVGGGDVSSSGDLGYTYGEYEYIPPGSDTPTERGNYVKAWQRQADGSWRIIVDLMTPLAPAEG